MLGKGMLSLSHLVSIHLKDFFLFSGLEIATNTVASATKFFSLTTKIVVWSPVWQPEFCMI